MSSKEELLKNLVDQYRFTYAEAKDIVDREDAAMVYSYIARAYQKGRNSIVESYRYSGGL